MKRILSGIQPTGALHIGNYIGAVQQWVNLQDGYDAFYFIVDSHAITVRQDPKELKYNIRLGAATYMACGLDPEKVSIFVQSAVPGHAELAWVLNTFTQMGELERMTQYKDKVAAGKPANAGLFTYPILMAADILLYKTELVPVGEDQKQHVELTRNIAERFNNHYEKEVFVVPEPVILETGARVMSLDDATRKMSKSSESEMGRIMMTDEPDLIRKKIMRAVTDSDSEVRAGDDKPELTNLLTIFSAVTQRHVQDIVDEFSSGGYGDFKKGLAEAVVEWITPIQEKMDKLVDSKELEEVLQEGQKKAHAVAQQTLQEVYETVGLGL